MDEDIKRDGWKMKNRFKQIRKHYGLSQAQFAQKINMSPGFISNVETGRSQVSERTIDAICDAFPINRSWLETGEGVFASQGMVDKTGAGLRVREVRKRYGLTQDEFAKRVGYSKIQVLSVEKGKITPSNQFLEKIVKEFKVSTDWLFTGEGSMDNRVDVVDDELINWLNNHPEVIRELRERGGLNDTTKVQV